MDDFSEQDSVSLDGDKGSDEDSSCESICSEQDRQIQTQSYKIVDLSQIPPVFHRVTGFTVAEFCTVIFPLVSGVVAAQFLNRNGRKRKLSS